MRFLIAGACVFALTVGLFLPASADAPAAQSNTLVGSASSFEVTANGDADVTPASFEVAAVPGIATVALASKSPTISAPTFGADQMMWNVAVPVPASKPLSPAASAPSAQAPSSALGSFAGSLIRQTRGIASQLTASALRFVGTPYMFGGTSSYGFDCSGYVQHVFALFGINLPRTADEQYLVGRHVSQRDMVRGDLVFFQTYAAGVSHVGIYLGNGEFVHSGSRGVQVSNLSDDYWSTRYVGATHILGASVVAAHFVN